MAQKASFSDKITIFSLEAKIVELEGKLKNIDLERTYHDLDVMGRVIEKSAQISSFKIESLRLELERANEDLNSKRYEIECMEKGIEATHEITSRELDALFLARSKLMEKNAHLQELLSKKDNEVDTPLPPMNNSSQPSALNPSSQLISVSGTEAVPLPATVPIIASSLMSPIIIYSILTLLLIAIIWFVVGEKIWNIWEKNDRYFTYKKHRNRPDIYYLNT